MKARIEFSQITRSYFVQVGPQTVTSYHTGQRITRKDEAERIAKKLGATEIEHRNRNTTRDLERNVGLSHETAKRVAHDNFRGGRR